MQFKTQAFTISDLYNWHRSGELFLQPRFQRRRVWSAPAKSYLIDTVVRGLPIPKIYFRMQVDAENMRSVREIVDGQQRLDAIFGYLQDGFRVYRHHNAAVGGKRFSELPSSIREQILAYDIAADLLIGADDPQVLQVFARINSYAVTLNPQEKRNAKYFGVFKSTAYDLGTSHLRFWLDRRVLTDQAIARMAEAELASELMVGLIAGLQDKKASIDKYYGLYEDQFPAEREIRTKFEQVIAWVGRNVELEQTVFTRRALFYSLFMAVADALFSIERGRGPIRQLERTALSSANRARLNRALIELSHGTRAKEPPADVAEFAIAASRQTDNIGPRRIRHDHLLELIQAAAGD